MTNDEIQKTMEFILEQRAQSSATIDALAVAQERSEKKWDRTEEGIRALLSIAEIHEREIASHANQILSLGDTTRATDERLNALINIGKPAKWWP